jgi:hypothetical protein
LPFRSELYEKEAEESNLPPQPIHTKETLDQKFFSELRNAEIFVEFSCKYQTMVFRQLEKFGQE